MKNVLAPLCLSRGSEIFPKLNLSPYIFIILLDFQKFELFKKYREIDFKNVITPLCLSKGSDSFPTLQPASPPARSGSRFLEYIARWEHHPKKNWKIRLLLCCSFFFFHESQFRKLWIKVTFSMSSNRGQQSDVP